MSRFLLIVIVLLLPLPRSIQAQAGSPSVRIEAARNHAREAGIPTSLVDSKIAEGRAKGVPFEVIARAVEERVGLLIRARAIMAAQGRGVGASDLSVGADVLRAGVGEAALRDITLAAPEENRAVALAVLAQLVQQGVPVGTAMERVREALARGGQALLRVPAQAADARQRRGPPASAGRRPAAVPGPGQKPAGERNKRGGRPGSRP